MSASPAFLVPGRLVETKDSKGPSISTFPVEHQGILIHPFDVSYLAVVKSFESRPALCDPVDYSSPGSPVHGILQARIQDGLPCPPPRDLPQPGIVLTCLTSPALSGGFFTVNATWEALYLAVAMPNGITDSMHMSLSKLWGFVMDREAWRAVIHGVAKSWT